MDTRAFRYFSGASPSASLSALPISRARVGSSNGSTNRIISMDGPPSGSFNRTNANDKGRIPTSASSKALTIRDGSPPVQRPGRAVSRSFKHLRSRVISWARDSSGASTSDRLRARCRQPRQDDGDYGHRMHSSAVNQPNASGALESEPRGQLNLAPSANGGE